MDRSTTSPKDKPSSTSEQGRTSGGPFAIQLPPDAAVLAEARRLVGDRSTRMEELAVCVSQDPVSRDSVPSPTRFS
ncbi:MAG: hypothetical protein EBZ48_04655 [Proteobacteria bacterium]|nr:hypothetical protein [Pseudomonadota bacterium]